MAALQKAGPALAPATLRELREAALADEHGTPARGHSGAARAGLRHAERMRASYRDDPAAIRALVQPDRVHRDLYIDPELFALEQEHFFANTWNYVGHDCQLPKPGDWIRAEIAGQPLIVVRHQDGERPGADEPLRAQGLAAGERAGRPRRPALPLPVPRLDLPHRRLAPQHPAEGRLRGHGTGRMRVGQGPGDGEERAPAPRLRLRQAQRRRARLRGATSASR